LPGTLFIQSSGRLIKQENILSFHNGLYNSQFLAHANAVFRYFLTACVIQFKQIKIIPDNLFIKPVVEGVGDIPKSLFLEDRLSIAGLSIEQFWDLVVPALSIAALGMIESLLCGASASKMKKENFNADRELVAQGIGNMVIPLFGGVPATAAIARTSVVIKAGSETRLAGIIHAAILLLSMFVLAPIMSAIPLSALSGILIVTAWRMNDWEDIKKIFDKKFKSAIAQFIITMIATVIFDLTIAICAGVVLSILLFIIKSSELSVNVSNVDTKKTAEQGISGSYKYTKLVYIAGPLFFGTQGKITETVRAFDDTTLDVIFSMRAVPSIDSGAIEEFEEIYEYLTHKNISVLFCGINPSVMKMLERSGFVDKIGRDKFLWDAIAAIKEIEKKVFIDE